MTWSTAVASGSSAAPLVLFRFGEGATTWRFAARRENFTNAEGTWAASGAAHSDLTQSGSAERGEVTITFPRTDDFAQRFTGFRGRLRTTVTILWVDESAVNDTVSVFAGRVLGAEREGATITLRCDAGGTALGSGAPLRWSRLCPHAHYGQSLAGEAACGVDIEDHYTEATATGRTGLAVTVTEAGLAAAGLYTAGVMRYGTDVAWIRSHSGTTLTLFSRLPALEAAIDDSAPVAVEIAPGCDLTVATCRDRFSNLLNCLAIDTIPTDNPFSVALR